MCSKTVEVSSFRLMAWSMSTKTLRATAIVVPAPLSPVDMTLAYPRSEVSSSLATLRKTLPAT